MRSTVECQSYGVGLETCAAVAAADGPRYKPLTVAGGVDGSAAQTVLDQRAVFRRGVYLRPGDRQPPHLLPGAWCVARRNRHDEPARRAVDREGVVVAAGGPLRHAATVDRVMPADGRAGPGRAAVFLSSAAERLALERVTAAHRSLGDARHCHRRVHHRPAGIW